jgi:hypothetical protein
VKCPYCKRQINAEIITEEYETNSTVHIFLQNFAFPMILLAVLGSSFEILKRGSMLAILFVGFFGFVYSILYVFKKVKGRLLIYDYWISKRIR